MNGFTLSNVFAGLPEPGEKRPSKRKSTHVRNDSVGADIGDAAQGVKWQLEKEPVEEQLRAPGRMVHACGVAQAHEPVNWRDPAKVGEENREF